MRTPSMLLLDAQLLVLLLVGLTDPNLIQIHKRLRAYTLADFDLLASIVSEYARIAVTPNILTEASNLARQIAEPHRSLIAETFKAVVLQAEERHQPSAVIVRSPHFVTLGLADAGSINMARELPLLTADLDLYLAAHRDGAGATNFSHLREQHTW